MNANKIGREKGKDMKKKKIGLDSRPPPGSAGMTRGGNESLKYVGIVNLLII